MTSRYNWIYKSAERQEDITIIFLMTLAVEYLELSFTCRDQIKYNCNQIVTLTNFPIREVVLEMFGDIPITNAILERNIW